MNSKDIIQAIGSQNFVKSYGVDHVDILGVAIDSRRIGEGTLFAAIKGSKVDGHNYIDKALDLGAKCVVMEQVPTLIRKGISYIQVLNSAKAVGIVAHELSGNPTKEFKVIGVTGTNGKTTIATLLYQLFTAMGFKCGLVSTVENIIGNRVVLATHTTPDTVGLADLFSQMRDEACTHVFMEVSSHALDQDRVSGIHFDGAIFSNITHDHLDYHITFLNYIKAKKKFFDDLEKTAFALVNADDKNGKIMLESTQANKKSYSLRSLADYRARIINSDSTGLHMMIDQVEVYMRMVGEFNAYNLLAVYGAAIEMGFEKERVLTQLSALTGAEGRMDLVRGRGVTAFVDYAHTPDALENVLRTLKKTISGNARVIVVAGCGGDRDAAKRPEMGKIASELADVAIFTSDNPRMEDPNKIIEQMMDGVKLEMKSKVVSIVDRLQAIKTAVLLSKEGDIILVAGKGHEKYQDIYGEKLPFEDKKELEALLSDLS